MPRAATPPEDRFWDKVQKGDEQSCWPWIAACGNGGYGVMGLGGKGQGNIRATHVSWKIHRGENVPPKMFVLHRCDNPNCVNPAHLFLGDQAENVRDMKAKGRDCPPPTSSGEENGYAKLTISDVRRIRRLASGVISHDEVAQLIGVSRSCVTAVLSGKNWSHLK